ncbi:MAG: MAG3450 family membrane protein [Metamycoplasmataceae bacterium]
MKNKKNIKNDNIILNTRSKSWIRPLYTLFVVAIPSFFIWFFLGKDFRTDPPFSIGYNVLIAIAFIIIISAITILLVFLKILKMSIIIFTFPITICFMAIFLSSWLQGEYQWYRVLIIIPLVFIVIPINMFVNYYERKQIIKIKIKKQLYKNS